LWFCPFECSFLLPLCFLSGISQTPLSIHTSTPMQTPFSCVRKTFLPFPTRIKILTDQDSQTCNLQIVQMGTIPSLIIIVHMGAISSYMIPTTGILCSEASGLQKAPPMPISTTWWTSSAFLPIPLIYATITSGWLKGMGSPFNLGITSLSLMVCLFSAFLASH